eukprot:COSAG02_NODE_51_length_44689_cov_29.477361_34_plen_34_part_00
MLDVIPDIVLMECKIMLEPDRNLSTIPVLPADV